MSGRDERLRQFFGGYFNQDWSAGGAGSWRDVVADYVRQVPKAHAAGVVEDLRSWVAEAEAEGLNNLPADFACDYDPQPDGKTERQWAKEVADAIEKQLTN